MGGKFITIEGGEGVGKSTQLAMLRRWLTAAVPEVVFTREPGGTPRAERIRELLLENSSEAMPRVSAKAAARPMPKPMAARVSPWPTNMRVRVSRPGPSRRSDVSRSAR